jgi:phytoene dehydrogenase-like protein
MYDSIIIGRDLSSLVAALASCRQGFKTLLLSEGTFDSDWRQGGYTFSIEPEPFPGLTMDQSVLRRLKELHPAPADAPPLLAVNPAFQVILPGHRIDLFADRGELLRELVREYPDEASEIQHFYRAVGRAASAVEHWTGEDLHGPPGTLSGFFRDLLRLPQIMLLHSSLAVRSRTVQPCFRQVIDAQLSSLSHLARRNGLLPLSAAYLLSLPARGMSYPCGGRNAWTSWIRDGFLASGGTLIDSGSVMRIDLQPDIAVDLERSGSPVSLRGKRLIVSAQWEKLNLLLLPQKRMRRLARRLQALGGCAFPFSLHMGVHQDGLPERMAPFVVVVPDGRDDRIQGPVLLKCSLPGETSRAPEGRRALSATVFLDESPLVLADSQLRDVAKSILDSLEGFLPFLRDSIDHLEVEQSIVHSRNSQEMVSHHYRCPRSAWLALDLLSPKTPQPNLFLTGSLLRAGLGFEGEILSGMDAALWAGRKELPHE